MVSPHSHQFSATMERLRGLPTPLSQIVQQLLGTKNGSDLNLPNRRLHASLPSFSSRAGRVETEV